MDRVENIDETFVMYGAVKFICVVLAVHAGVEAVREVLNVDVSLVVVGLKEYGGNVSVIGLVVSAKGCLVFVVGGVKEDVEVAVIGGVVRRTGCLIVVLYVVLE